MEKLVLTAQFLSGLAFLAYGSSCLMSKKMILEFDRYHLSQYRVITGILQLLAVIGLFAGFFIPIFTLLSSLGLAVQMFLAVIVRLRIKDSLVQTVPAMFFVF